MDAARPLAQAIAVLAGRIVAVGSNQEIQSLVGPKTRIIDAKRATILPGFTDCHIHLIEYGLSLRNIGLRNAQSIEEVKEAVTEEARGLKRVGLGARLGPREIY